MTSVLNKSVMKGIGLGGFGLGLAEFGIAMVQADYVGMALAATNLLPGWWSLGASAILAFMLGGAGGGALGARHERNHGAGRPPARGRVPQSKAHRRRA